MVVVVLGTQTSDTLPSGDDREAGPPPSSWARGGHRFLSSNLCSRDSYRLYLIYNDSPVLHVQSGTPGEPSYDTGGPRPLLWASLSL